MKRSGIRTFALAAMAVSLTLAGCSNGKSNKEATQLPPPPPLESEPLPASLAAPATPVAVQEPVAPAPQPVAQQEVAPAPVQPGPAAPQVETRVYRVQKGDTLWSIARRFYGDGHAAQAIARANNLANPNQIQAGQDLVLP